MYIRDRNEVEGGDAHAIIIRALACFLKQRFRYLVYSECTGSLKWKAVFNTNNIDAEKYWILWSVKSANVVKMFGEVGSHSISPTPSPH